MAKVISQRVDTFLGLNNMLNPASAEYREGMAWRSKNARINESGLWSPRRLLTSCSNPPGLLAAWGGGAHFKNLAVENIDKIITGLATTECVDTGPNDILYGTTGSGVIMRRKADGVETECGTYTPPTLADPYADPKDGSSSRAENGTYYYMCTYFDNIYKRESLPSTVYSAEIDHDDGSKDYIQIKWTGAATSDERIRIYRTLRTCAAEGIYNSTNTFYLVNEVTSGTTYDDYMHDDDIRDT
ncbi:unnamed protein product, partial [marine sediment metagenome]